MTLGFFDLPAPLLQWVDDGVTAVVPASVSIALWAVVVGVLCIEIYRVTSPQQRIRRIKKQAKDAQQQLAGYDGEMEGAWPLIKSMLGLSLKRVGIVVPATLLAAYPVVALVLWLGSTYGHLYPAPGDTVDIDVPPSLRAQWIRGNATEPPRIQARRPDGEMVLEIPWAAPVSIVHKRVWWNALVANPAGYLPADAPVDEIRVDLPRREFVTAGPEWMRGWEVIFLPVLFVAALVYKTARHID